MVYPPLRGPQLLGIFRTRYSITGLALTGDKGVRMLTKREAYNKHVREIEQFLAHGKGGEFTKLVEHEIACECDCGHEHTRTTEMEMPYRLPYSYDEMLDLGLGANEELILIGLRGRVLNHSRSIPSRYLTAPDIEEWEWLSEVALGVAKHHHPSSLQAENPFKLGWREA
jgi:hypothetical protein